MTHVESVPIAVRRVVWLCAAALTVTVSMGAVLALGSGPDAASSDALAIQTRTDAAGDAVIRRTDLGVNGPFNETALPDVLSISISSWQANDPVADPYTGTIANNGAEHLVRLDVVFDGLLNPPGPIGLGFFPFDPYRFGDRPVYGFIELDIDRDKNSGGELGDTATLRYLANVGRFGALPEGETLNQRAARSANDYDGVLATSPQIERSGAEYLFGFCGCYDITLVSEDGNLDGHFDPGETFIVQGRFFRRVAGFQIVSAVFGGPVEGLYNPLVNVRFSHDITSDTTTITLVEALDMTGAAQLTGEPEQLPDFQTNNHHSVLEAMLDVVDGANGLNGPVPPDVNVLINRWRNQDPSKFLDPSTWKLTGLFGTTYSVPLAALYVWTDVGFDEHVGDFDGDGYVTQSDRLAIQQFIASNDGGAQDADGVANGSFQIASFGPNFSAFDINSSGAVDQQDVMEIPLPTLGDLNGDGFVDVFDLAALLSLWESADAVADLNADGIVDAFDLATLLSNWKSRP